MTLTYILNENNLTTDSDDYVAIVSTDGSATRVAIVGKNRRIANSERR